jgi:hypothetical protein
MTWFTPLLNQGMGQHQYDDEDGYWCVVCGHWIPADADAVIVHDRVYHPDIMSFDEDERKPN